LYIIAAAVIIELPKEYKLIKGGPEEVERSNSDWGYFEIILEEYLKTHDISKNKLAFDANLQRTQLNTYCKNAVRRPDLNVLARICYALNCDLDDILKYIRPTIHNGGNEND